MGKEETAVNKHTSFFCCVSSRSSSIISSAPVAFLISVPATSVPPIGPLHWRLPPPGMLPALPPPHPTSFSPLGLRGPPSYCLRQSLFSPLPSSLGAPILCSSKAVSTLETHLLISFFNSKKFFYLLYFLAALGLCCCTQAFSSCREEGLLSSCGAGASHCSGFSRCDARALDAWASVVVAHGLSCPMACGIFPDQGLNPYPLHYKAES